jgi:hypothetical protein
MGEQEAEALVTFVDHKIKDNDAANLKLLATKEDIHILKEDIAKLEGSLEAKISDVKSEMIKWMFIFWIGQVAVTFGLIIVYLKK